MFKRLKYYLQYKKVLKNTTLGASNMAYNCFYECYRAGLTFNACQRYKLIEAISESSEYIYRALLFSNQTQLNGNERLLLLSCMLRNDYDGKARYRYLKDLINNGFIFTGNEINYVAMYLLKFNETEVAKLLLEKYSIPTYIVDILESRMVISKLMGVK